MKRTPDQSSMFITIFLRIVLDYLHPHIYVHVHIGMTVDIDFEVSGI